MANVQPNAFLVDRNGQTLGIGITVAPDGSLQFVTYDANGRQVVSAGGGGASNFGSITGQPTDNSSLATVLNAKADAAATSTSLASKVNTSDLTAALAVKLSQATGWSAASNTPALASGVSSQNGCVYNSDVTPTAITTPITTTMYPNDWLVYTPSVSQWVQVSYLQNLASAPDLATADLSGNVTIQTMLSQIAANTTAISNVKSLPTSSTFSTTWDASSTKDFGTFTVTGPLAIVSNSANSVPGGYTQGTIVADGSNNPTFDGATISSYINTVGTRNKIKLERVGDALYWTAGSGGGTSLVKGAFALPAITGSPTPIASFDFGDSTKLTLSSGAIGSGGLISSIAGSDGTTYTLAQATTGKQPTSVIRNGQVTARITGGQFMSISNSMSRANTTTGYTMIAVVEFATNAATQGIVDFCGAGAAFAGTRDVLLASNTTGYSYRQYDNSNAGAAPTQGTGFTTAIHLMIGRTQAGTTGLSAVLNVDGIGTGVTAGTTSSTFGPNLFTVGGTNESNVMAKPLDGYLTRVWTFNTYLSDAQIEQFAVACASQYGTPNVA